MPLRRFPSPYSIGTDIVAISRFDFYARGYEHKNFKRTQFSPTRPEVATHMMGLQKLLKRTMTYREEVLFKVKMASWVDMSDNTRRAACSQYLAGRCV